MAENNIKVTALKIGLLGDSSVGKTAICQTFLGIEFKEDQISTIGTEKMDKKVTLKNGNEIKLILWDTAGEERFRAAALKAIRTVQGIALVFDVTKKTSLENINKWLDEIKENFQNPSLVLLGNKIDMEENKWQVTQDQIDALVKQKNLKYYPTSAKTNEGITESFTYLANITYDKVTAKGNKEDDKKKIELNPKPKEKKKCC